METYTCPICGFQACDYHSRTCPICTYCGDWIQPGETITYADRQLLKVYAGAELGTPPAST